MRSADPLGPGFRALYLGSLVSNVGDGVRVAALALLATPSNRPDVRLVGPAAVTQIGRVVRSRGQFR